MLGPSPEPPGGGSTAPGTGTAVTGERLPTQMFVGFGWVFWFVVLGLVFFFFSPEKLVWCTVHRGKYAAFPQKSCSCYSKG